MEDLRCPQCGAPINGNEEKCKYCGEKLPLKEMPIHVVYNNENEKSRQPITNTGSDRPSIHLSNTYYIGKRKKHPYLWIAFVLVAVFVLSAFLATL